MRPNQASPSVPEPWAQLSSIQGLKFFSRHLPEALEKLHAHCPDPKRKLFYDQYLCLFLLAYFNPVLNSLRALQAATQMMTVRRKLELPYASLGSLSEASHTFDPDLLRIVFERLAQKVVKVESPTLPKTLQEMFRCVAADASLWDTLPRMAKALYQEPLTRCRKGGFKGHFQFDILRGSPVMAHFTGGSVDERHVLPRQLQPGTLYLLDRGYESFALYSTILAQGSSFLARLREGFTYRVLHERALSEIDRKVGVHFDATVILGQDPQPDAKPLRVIKASIVSPPPHNLHPVRKGGKHKAYARSSPLLQEWILVTDRMDLDADILVLLYHYRWKIELFFRWLKCTMKCAHLFCESENGMKIQFYAALIASLLVLLYTGRKPCKRIWEALQLHFAGWAEWKDVEFYIAKYGKPALP